MANHIPKCQWNTESPYYNTHKCEACGKGFSDAKHHGSICKGAKDYQCEFCDQKFSGEDSVKRHVKRKHKEKLGDEFYQCEFCDQQYSVQDSVKRHVKIKHKEKLGNELPSAV
jgi:uncharacterized Zn-finger protein